MELIDGTDYRLDPELKTQWLDALRSGDYIQGRSKLKKSTTLDYLDGFSYCCLGVYADITNCSTLAPDTQYLDYGVIPKYVQRSLAAFNDNQLWGFDEIADWIEENL